MRNILSQNKMCYNKLYRKKSDRTIYLVIYVKLEAKNHKYKTKSSHHEKKGL